MCDFCHLHLCLIGNWKRVKRKTDDASRRCGGVYQKSMKNRHDTFKYSNLNTRRFTTKAFEI